MNGLRLLLGIVLVGDVYVLMHGPSVYAAVSLVGGLLWFAFFDPELPRWRKDA